MLKPVRDIFDKREDSGKVLYSCKMQQTAYQFYRRWSIF